MLINSDVLDVADRLKEVDSAYRLHYLPETGKFELKNDKGETLLVYPFKTIDPRMVYKAMETRIERSEELFAEIEKANAKVRETAERELMSATADAIKEGASEYYHAKRRRQI